jgi:hypothetical protein
LGNTYKPEEIIHYQEKSRAYHMESLESKLERLSPDQRKEIEDFVDFLMYRSGNLPVPAATGPVPARIQNVAPPPFVMQEPVQILENSPAKEPDASPGENPPAPVSREAPATPLHEVPALGEDRIARDYMDYGQFEQKSSPAIIAVKKVKEKLQKREEQERPRVSLDWID